MRRVFTLPDANPMGWPEFDACVARIIAQLKGRKFDAVVPILRSGAIPAAMIANKLEITTIIPVQLKYDYVANGVVTKIPPVVPMGVDSMQPLEMLIVECNTSSGMTARGALALLRASFPKARFYYATVAKVYGGPEAFPDCEGYYYGCLTNEKFLDNAPADARRGITIFPWETAEYELRDINSIGPA